jgi:hypothetical protein
MQEMRLLARGTRGGCSVPRVRGRGVIGAALPHKSGHPRPHHHTEPAPHTTADGSCDASARAPDDREDRDPERNLYNPPSDGVWAAKPQVTSVRIATWQRLGDRGGARSRAYSSSSRVRS